MAVFTPERLLVTNMQSQAVQIRGYHRQHHGPFKALAVTRQENGSANDTDAAADILVEIGPDL